MVEGATPGIGSHDGRMRYAESPTYPNPTPAQGANNPAQNTQEEEAMTARSLGVASTLALGLLAVGLGAGAAPVDLNSCQTIHSGGSYVVTQDLSNPAGHCLILRPIGSRST
jgi:hypothetical protein